MRKVSGTVRFIRWKSGFCPAVFGGGPGQPDINGHKPDTNRRCNARVPNKP
ncbi:hypothetical protein DPMN_148231 [Dreissena polymorpha]|uniref:Uncharacterized protein n=1 Tax=Dreissena polymorpha TaxID=45954 RepID=A0A9D4FDJ9_DREPO|nr:hypothetical protein DPMN_148188 [Dreissena polymorpha]KAH3794693.1 hypothetical protein DPMN_148231 [Dreissena polymorpha]